MGKSGMLNTMESFTLTGFHVMYIWHYACTVFITVFQQLLVNCIADLDDCFKYCIQDKHI